MIDELFETEIKKLKAIVIGINDKKSSYEIAIEYFEEFKFLVRSADAEIVYEVLLNVDAPKAGTYLGTGKLAELEAVIKDKNAELAVFDDELSPSQVRNIEKTLGVRILDRAGLILLIFSERARTAQAKTQVELAQLQYMLPRLTKMWSHLSRQRGGVGLKGAGEQEIETDRRIIRDRIAKLKVQLTQIEKQDATRRKNRDSIARVALVGYTNVGKSTLMNALSKSDILAENKLFATLDSTVRKVVIDGVPFLLSDTVGFIRKLPTLLIESFKSTLAEVREADLLLHVVDISNPHYIEQIKIVKNTLADVKAIDKPVIMVFNKIDQIDDEDMQDLEKTWMSNAHAPAVFIAAGMKMNLDKLRKTILEQLDNVYKEQFPNSNAYRIYTSDYTNTEI